MLWHTDFLKLTVYLSFFTILFMFYGLPIHIMRDVFLTLRSFFKRISDFLRFRNATRDMNERYPDATAEDIGREDVCIICREDMRPWQPNDEVALGRDGLRPARRQARAVDERLRPKKLPCGHVLHFGCLRSWLERQQICPTCRRPVLVANRLRVVPAIAPALNANQAMGGQVQQIQLRQPPGDPHRPVIQEHAPGGLNRARVFNFGPFRFAMGQAHGNPFQDQLRMPNDGQAGHQAVDPAPPQPYGFSFGFQRPQANPPDTSAAHFSPAGVQTHLRQIEQQIMQEINSLRASADQMTLVRALQGELARLRIAQANSSAPPIGQPLNVVPPPPGSRPLHPVAQSLPNTSTMQAYGQAPQFLAMGPGHQDMPPGLTIPEGWTLLPLQRIQQAAIPSHPAVPSYHPQSYLSHRTAEPSSHRQFNSSHTSPRFRPASSPSGLPQTPAASGMIGANATSRRNTAATSLSSSVDTNTSQPQPEQNPASSVMPTMPHTSGGKDQGQPRSAPDGQEDNLRQIYDEIVDVNGSAYGQSSVGSPEIGTSFTAPIPAWNSEPQAEHQDGQGTIDGTSKNTISTSSEAVEGTTAAAASGQSRQSKGKGRAATVEDFIDDLD